MLSGLSAARAETPGSLDLSFSPALGISASTVRAIAVQPDGKLLIGGYFTSINNTPQKYLSRLNANGSVDSSFVGANADYPVRAIVVQPDGRIVVAGEFSTINGTSWRGIARLNADGSPDSTFGSYAGMDGYVRAAVVQPDGKIVIGGTFTTVNGTPHNYLARLNTDGSLDTGFNATTGRTDGYVDALALRPDGKILVGGEFDYVNNVPKSYLAQLNSDGTLDTSFDVTLDNYPNTIALQTNGQAVIGGRFGKINGVTQNYVGRLNVDGSRDGVFPANAGGTVNAIAIQPNGKIVLAGQFNNINGTTRYNIGRVDANGILDSAFDTGAGTDSSIRTIALQADGKLVIGGDFTSVSSVSRTFVARLAGDPPPAVPTVGPQIWTAVEIGWPSAADKRYQVQWSSEAAPTAWQNLGSVVSGTGTNMTLFDSTRNSPRKFYRVIEVQ